LQQAHKRPHFDVLSAVQGSAKLDDLWRRPASEAEIRRWFERDPNARLGISTGKVSGGLVVADIDDVPPGFRHPPTPTVQTGRGLHVYAQSAESLEGHKARWGEVKGDREYVVAPPSLHETGAAYRWLIAPSDCPLVEVKDLPLLRQWYSGTTALGEALCSALTTPSTGDKQFAAIPPAVEETLPVLGIHAAIGQRFLCVAPGHEEKDPSASIWAPAGRVHRYYDFHRRDREQSWTLAEIRAAQVGGRRLARLKGTLEARWYRRLFAEAGVIALPDLALAALPPGTPAYVERVRQGFLLLLRVRDGKDPGEPMPFTRGFARDWCGGISEHHARSGIAELKRLAVIEKVGEHPAGAGRRSMDLFRPGPGPSTLQRAEARARDRQQAGEAG
jgi:Bifunctional DNA primase/polymerase, N-terminal